MSVWFTWSIREAKPGSSVLVSTVFDRSKYFFLATLAMNLLCTLLIAYKLWAVGRAVREYTQTRRGANALFIVLESAAIYTTVLTCLIALSITNNSAMFFFLNSMPPLIGSVFSYVILRSTSSDATRYTSTMVSSTLTGDSRSTGRSGGFLPKRRERDTTRPLDNGVHVHLERMIHADSSVGGEVTGKRQEDHNSPPLLEWSNSGDPELGRKVITGI
ncbi:hypothetical protein VNI00_002379 [Paramarasmius palmivorus]|uniref:Uncharacterized protein n=1 Tax=Paramarasmius palmivorus TaxID=297713 RepID=A0AAW0DYR0_9AGAR